MTRLLFSTSLIILFVNFLLILICELLDFTNDFGAFLVEIIIILVLFMTLFITYKQLSLSFLSNGVILFNPLFFNSLICGASYFIPLMCSILGIYKHEIEIVRGTYLKGILYANLSQLTMLLSFYFMKYFKLLSNIKTDSISIITYSEYRETTIFLLFIISLTFYLVVLYGRYELIFEQGFYLGSGVQLKPRYLQETFRIFDFGGIVLLLTNLLYISKNKKLTHIYIMVLLTIVVVVGIDIYFAILYAQKERLFADVLALSFGISINNLVKIKTVIIFLFTLSFLILSVGPLFSSIRSEDKIEQIHKSPISSIVKLKDDVVAEEDGVLQYILNRIDETLISYLTLNLFPSQIDFQYGKTYIEGIKFAIPFSDKKELPLTEPNSWGRTIGLIPSFDFITGIRISWQLEAYINFGILGILIVSAIYAFCSLAIFEYFYKNVNIVFTVLYYAFFYNFCVLFTHNGFPYIIKNIFMWSLSLFLFYFLIKLVERVYNVKIA